MDHENWESFWYIFICNHYLTHFDLRLAETFFEKLDFKTNDDIL